ncbi:unnamed protein product [Linum tenue]|uniref:Pentatricopeptide repeat-containing protein n=1 Tax=Linum tenue TaxID=586396 RepID=A0AAV0PP46_9ROSI|nr:unnamed protein product [Linum tenue]
MNRLIPVSSALLASDEHQVFDVLPVTENNTAVVEKSFVSCKEVSDQESCKLFPFVAMAVKTLNLGAVREGKFVQAVRFHGYAHSIRAFKMVIEVFAVAGLENNVQFLLRDIVSYHRGVDLDVLGLSQSLLGSPELAGVLSSLWSVLIKFMAEKKLMENAVSVSVQAKENKFEPHIFSCEVDEALKLLEEMRSTRISSDIYSYSILIHGFCQKGDFEKCDDLWKEMAYWNIHPNIVMHSSRVSGVAVDMYFFRNSILLCEGIGRSASLS